MLQRLLKNSGPLWFGVQYFLNYFATVIKLVADFNVFLHTREGSALETTHFKHVIIKLYDS